MTIAELARWMHEHYEMLAVEEGWGTQKETRVDFDDLPEANKRVMVRMAAAIQRKMEIAVAEAMREQKELDIQAVIGIPNGTEAISAIRNQGEA